MSGHLDFYEENMFDQMKIEDENFQLRPMNFPYHILVYKRKLNSYCDFPIRVAELGTVYRYELSGSLYSLFRVRGFTQDDAHIFCLEDQIKDEIRGILDLTEEILLQFSFNKYKVNLSTIPRQICGQQWEKATCALRDALDDKGWRYQIDKGGGAFYDPKIDIKIEDGLGRKWKCSIVQLEYCKEMMSKLKENGIRAEVCHGERLPNLIGNSERQKIPLVVVVGPKEVETQSVTIRSRFSGELGNMKIDDFISRVKSATARGTSL